MKDKPNFNDVAIFTSSNGIAVIQVSLHAANLGSFLSTFEEFISFLSMNENSNSFGLVENHWSTYNRLCQPCTIKYDVIAHLETIEEDSRLVS